MQPGLTTALCQKTAAPWAVRPLQGGLRFERNDGNFQVSLVRDNSGTGPDVGDESQPCRKAK